MSILVTEINGITKIQDGNFYYYLFPRAYFKANLTTNRYKQSSNEGYSIDLTAKFEDLTETYTATNIVEYLDYIAEFTTLYNDRRAKITEEAAAESRFVYNSYLTSDGTQTGPNDLRVDGSVNPMTYFVAPQQKNFDLYISSIVFTIADAGASLNKFGNIGSLTNGCEFFYKNDEGERIIQSNLVSNFRFGEMCGFNPAFGNGNSVLKANNVVGNSEAFIFKYDFKSLNGFSTGIRLAGGTNQQIGLRIKDNVIGVDLFTAYSFGFEFKKIGA